MPIIFNLKAFLVGIVAVIVTIITAKLHLSTGPSFVLIGLAGLVTSVALSSPYVGYMKLPLVFFIPTHLPAALIVILGIVGWNDKDEEKTSTAPESKVSQADVSRISRGILREDLTRVQEARYTGDTVLLKVIDAQMRVNLMSALRPDSSHYLLRYNSDTSAALLLMTSDITADMAEDVKQKEMFVIYTAIPSLRGAKRYIGIIGPEGLFALKTPGEEFKEKSFAYDEDELAAFYTKESKAGD